MNFNYDPFPSTVSNVKNNYQKYEEVNLINDLIQNYKKLAVKQKEDYANKIPLDNYSFNTIIRELNESPNSLLLDLLKSCLVKFKYDKYLKVIEYIKNINIKKFTRMYLIETIINWDNIDPEKRINDLKNVMDKESDILLQNFISESIEEIKQECI